MIKSIINDIIKTRMRNQYPLCLFSYQDCVFVDELNGPFKLWQIIVLFIWQERFS